MPLNNILEEAYFYNTPIKSKGVTIYEPTQEVIDKIRNYRDKGSMVNVKAIKTFEKMMAYYFAARLLGWDELAYKLKNDYPLPNNRGLYSEYCDAVDAYVTKNDTSTDTNAIKGMLRTIMAADNVIPVKRCIDEDRMDLLLLWYAYNINDYKVIRGNWNDFSDLDKLLNSVNNAIGTNYLCKVKSTGLKWPDGSNVSMNSLYTIKDWAELIENNL